MQWIHLLTVQNGLQLDGRRTRQIDHQGTGTECGAKGVWRVLLNLGLGHIWVDQWMIS